MLSALTDSAFSLLLSVGLPALFVLFVLKGAIIGKLLPTSVFLPGYLVAISASRRTIGLSILVASLGYVCGQLLIYGVAYYRGIGAIRAIPGVTVSEEQLDRADELFQRYSGVGIFVTNLVPYVGTFIMIPAGITSYSLSRTTFYALTSTLLNYVLIVALVVESIAYFVPS